MTEALAAQVAGLDPRMLPAIGNVGADPDAAEVRTTLPSDHPQWQRDVVSISSRARSLLAALRPTAVRVLTTWDHQLREFALGNRTFGVDASGCYRLR
jgi:hypothetical protein